MSTDGDNIVRGRIRRIMAVHGKGARMAGGRDEINKQIHQKMGIYWHGLGGNKDFLSWEQFGEVLLPWCRKQAWWNEFTWQYAMSTGKLENILDHLEPGKFCDALIDFWKTEAVAP